MFDNEECRRQFKEHLIEMSNEENIVFYEICEEYKRMKSDRNRFYTAIHLVMRFIEPGSDFELNLPQRVRQECLTQFKLQCNINSCSETLFDRVASTIFLQMKVDAYPRFNHSPEFKNFITALIKKDRSLLDTIAVRSKSSSSSANTNSDDSPSSGSGGQQHTSPLQSHESFFPRWMKDIDRMEQNKKQNMSAASGGGAANNSMNKIREMFMMHRSERRISNPPAPTLAQLNSSLFDDDDTTTHGRSNTATSGGGGGGGTSSNSATPLHHTSSRYHSSSNASGGGGGMSSTKHTDHQIDFDEEFDSGDEFSDDEELFQDELLYSYDDDQGIDVSTARSERSIGRSLLGRQSSSLSNSPGLGSGSAMDANMEQLVNNRTTTCLLPQVPKKQAPLPLTASTGAADQEALKKQNSHLFISGETYNASYSNQVDIWGTLIEEQLREEQQNMMAKIEGETGADYDGAAMDEMTDHSGKKLNAGVSLRKMIKKLGELPNELSMTNFNDPYIYASDFERVRQDCGTLDGWDRVELDSKKVPAHFNCYIGNEKYNIVDQDRFECIRRYRFSGRLPIPAHRAIQYFCTAENAKHLDSTLINVPTFLVMVKNLEGETATTPNSGGQLGNGSSPRLSPNDFSHAFAGYISHHTHKYTWPIKNRSFLTVQSVIYDEPSPNGRGQYLSYKKSVNIEDAKIATVEKLRGLMTESVIFKEEEQGCSFTVIQWYDMKKQFNNSTFQKIMKSTAMAFADPQPWIGWDKREPQSKRASTILASKPSLYDTLEYYLLVKELSTKESVQKKVRRTMVTLNTLVNCEMDPFATIHELGKYSQEGIVA